MVLEAVVPWDEPEEVAVAQLDRIVPAGQRGARVVGFSEPPQLHGLLGVGRLQMAASRRRATTPRREPVHDAPESSPISAAVESDRAQYALALDAMSYRELQAEAKRRGVRANGKKIALVAALLEAVDAPSAAADASPTQRHRHQAHRAEPPSSSRHERGRHSGGPHELPCGMRE
jgi:hypothetical protein